MSLAEEVNNMRKKLILLCVTFVFLAILCIIHVLPHQRKSRDGYKTPFTTNAQANIASSGDYMYYCNVRQNKALCCYNLKTQKTQILLEEIGELKQTITAIYYIANQEVYQISDNTIQKVYSIPNSDFYFVDVVNESVYWISYDSTESEKSSITSPSMYRLYQKNPTNDAPPEVLWEQSEACICDAVYYHERIYMLTDHGIYYTLPDSKETKKISDFAADCFVYNDAFLLFKHASGDSMQGYYEITEDLQTQQKSAVIGPVESVYNETLYYPFSETLWSINLFSEERNRNYEGHLPGYPWSAIKATVSGVFLRCYLTADILFYEFETGNINCIVPQQQTK